jgi:hypothetical protein
MKSLIASVAVIITIAGASYAGVRHDDRLQRDYGNVQVGMSVDAAQHILGKPSWQGQCDGYDHVGGYSPNCASKLLYRSAFAPLKPVYWVVELDRRGRVISSALEASP